MKNYNEERHYEENAVDYETGETILPSESKAPVTKLNPDVEKLLHFAELKRGAPFSASGKNLQRKAVREILATGVPAKEIAVRWDDMAEEDYWKARGGFDFKNVASSFDRKPYKKP